MLDLLAQLLSRMTLIITIAFLITRLSIFRRIIYHHLSIKGSMMLAIIFGLFGIIGNYTAVVVHPETHIISNLWNPHLQTNNAIADTRNIGIIIGGFVGGPIVGIGSALIAGGHRLILGGFISEASFVASIIGGCIAGWFGRKLRFIGLIRPLHMFMIGGFIVTVQILLIPFLAVDHSLALHLIKFTGIPIIVINSVGIWICAVIFYSVVQEEERTRANQTAKALSIADQTLSLFRQGLNESSATKATRIIQQLTDVDHTAITRGIRQLAHTGSVALREKSQQSERVYRERVLKTGKMEIIQPNTSALFHRNPQDPAFIVLPLRVKQRTIGTLTFYYRNPNQINPVEREFAEGLGNLFSSQLEFGEIERHNYLLQDAEMKAFHAQIQPHFLFNALNTIVALCRTDPMLARKLLIHLSTFLRNNLSGITDRIVSLEKELENVFAYLAIEQARFPDKFELNVDIHPEATHMMIPPFILQPLVENAITHGELKEMEGMGKIHITITPQNETHLKVTVSDNGVGIPSERLRDLGQRKVESSKQGSGTALFNIKERLTALFSQDATFSMNSTPGEGTCVTITLPIHF
ncbi:LytS/YhcK type 5TM receptor domain-containing protein [Aciduricibacillus chroicocephali]|uniref:histidine kinase n=1 Tax=Aciduricibacillus chroicocephali TaxID=3054939 RepID=A0ABY9KXS4_9BACI|nr:LytS/YhcK type 5TM receptor domain-containing protein [Bacillaceae bacterium 44XB]